MLKELFYPVPTARGHYPEPYWRIWSPAWCGVRFVMGTMPYREAELR